MMISRFLLLIVVALLFSACAAPITPSPIVTDVPTDHTLPTLEPTQAPVQVETSPTSESIPVPTTTTTYTDDFAGFSLDYPANWFLESSALMHAEESVGYNISIASWDILNPPTPGSKDLNTLPSGGTKIDVAVTKQPMMLEEAVTQISESSGPILARKDVTLAGALPGVIVDVQGFAGLTRTLITVLNGNVIYVSGYGNLEPFEAIALTLRAK
jgi:hypothetical protein